MVYPSELKMDFEKLKPILVDAFTHVYGSHNQDVIADRINKIYLNDYLTYDDISMYYNQINRDFRRKLLVKLINDLYPNTGDISDLWMYFRKNPEIHDEVKLLMNFNESEPLYIYSDDVFIVDDYRIVELFDDDIYSKLDDKSKEKVDKKRSLVIDKLGDVSKYIELVSQLDKEYSKFLDVNNSIVNFLEDNYFTRDKSIEETCRQSKDKLKDLNIVTDCELTIDDVENSLTCCVPVLVNNNGLRGASLIDFPRLSSIHNGKRDVTFIHEIMHAIELELLDISYGYAIFKSGFETNIYAEFKGKDYPHKDRNYEAMSEAIHNHIANEVTGYLHQKGIYIFGSDNIDNNPDIKYTSPYDKYFDIVEPLFSKYRQDILDARLSIDSFNKFKEKISDEKLVEINELVKYAINNLGSIFGVDNKTREYRELVSKSKNIVEKDDIKRL